MLNRSLLIYFFLLALLCTALIIGAHLLGERGAYLAQFYMLTPALAAVITRQFFYEPRFRDANLKFGRLADYFRYWLLSLGIVALYFLSYTLIGAITWDITGSVFISRLSEQFAQAGQDISSSLPPGFTPRTMLLLFSVGGLTVFNVLPGLITGLGEELGHRGFMFPLLYRIRPWVGIIIGGLIWYAWHWPLALLLPTTRVAAPLWESIANWTALAFGSVLTFAYLAYVYIRTRSIFVVSIAHITMNNASIALSYYVILQDQFLANLGTVLVMGLVAVVLYLRGSFRIFEEYSPYFAATSLIGILRVARVARWHHGAPNRDNIPVRAVPAPIRRPSCPR